MHPYHLPYRDAYIEGTHLRPDPAWEQRVFLYAFWGRLIVILLFALVSAYMFELSRDSRDYHEKSKIIAEHYATGNINWSLWIDEGWFQFIGVIYWLLAPHITLIQLLNAAFSGIAGILVYRIVLVVYQNQSQAKVTSLLTIFFPSALYYTSLPLKEAPAVLGILLTLWGIVRINCLKEKQALWMVVAGLCIVAALRVYLCYVLLLISLISLVPVQLSSRRNVVFQIIGYSCGLVLLGIILMKNYDIDPETYKALDLHYFDINYINHVRAEMSTGNTGLFEKEHEAGFGDSTIENLLKAGRGLFYFFFTINPAEINRGRQLAALPEILFFVFSIPYIIAGVKSSVKFYLDRSWPVLLFAISIIAVYSAATTNAGSMYRWRVQALPLIFMIIVHGAAVRNKGFISNWLYRAR